MRRKPHLRWMILVVFAGALAVLLGALLAPRPVAVDAADMRRGPIAETVSDEGVARVRQSYVVSAPIGGRLERLPLEVGDPVEANRTVVARLRPVSAEFLDPRARARAEALIAAARSAMASASAQRDRLAADAARARTDLQRQETLSAKGFTSRQALDNARTAAEVARNAVLAADADIRSRRAEVTAAEAALTGPEALAAQTIAITSPASGVVTRLLQQSERTVIAGAPLVEIGATTGLEAQIEFLSQDAVRIRPGDKAEIYDWGGPKDIPAEVRLVEPQGFTKISALGVEEQRALVMLQFTGPPSSWAGLAPGYRVWARVYLRRTPSALLAPSGALVREAGGWAAYRIEGGHARLRPVQVGVITDRDAEILQGLSVGDRLVLYPSDKVRDGVRVKPRG
jgi:HlyD family secretion protein